MNDEKLTPQSETPEAPKQDAPVATQASPDAGVAPSAEASTPSEPAADAPKEKTPAPAAEEAKPATEAPAAKVETPKTEVKAPSGGGSKTEDEKLFEAALADLGTEEKGGGRDTQKQPGLRKGERVEAKVILVEKDRVFVDLGLKAEGVIPLNELATENLETAEGHVSVGDKFDVIVLRSSNSEGNPEVSKRRADFDVQWQKILGSFEEGEVFDAAVVDRVKGGLVVDIGVRGFVPATHVGSGKLRNIEKFVGQTMMVKIIEVDRERRKVVLSNRAAEEERKDEIKEKLFTETKPQDVLEGVVRRLTDYGAFVDLGGIDGLLHISEMSWARIDHPREVLKEGQEIKVMVLRLDEGSGRISLGLRQVLPDPWKLIRENYKLGGKLKLAVSRMVQSGAFLKLEEGAEAFLPLSEISDKKLKKPQDELEVGQEVEPTIIDLRPDERRMVLSLRENPNIGGGYSGGYGGDRMGGGGMGGGGRRRPGGHKRRNDETAEAAGTTRLAPTGGATIGERLGLLKGLMKDDDPAAAGAAEAKPKPKKAAPKKEDAKPVDAAAEAKPADKPAEKTEEKPAEKTEDKKDS